jgi:hypothetical protein
MPQKSNLTTISNHSGAISHDNKNCRFWPEWVELGQVSARELVFGCTGGVCA